MTATDPLAVELDRLRALADAAIRGEWRVNEGEVLAYDGDFALDGVVGHLPPDGPTLAFIAASHAAVPALVEALVAVLDDTDAYCSCPKQPAAIRTAAARALGCQP